MDKKWKKKDGTEITRADLEALRAYMEGKIPQATLIPAGMDNLPKLSLVLNMSPMVSCAFDAKGKILEMTGARRQEEFLYFDRLADKLQAAGYVKA